MRVEPPVFTEYRSFLLISNLDAIKINDKMQYTQRVTSKVLCLKNKA